MDGRSVQGRSLAICVAMGLLAAEAGCSTHAKRLAEPRSLFYNGQLELARERLEKISKSHRRDRDVVELDLAMLELVSGQPRQAENRLRAIRDRFDQLEGSSLAEKTLSLWTDDQTRSYAGEDYEKVFIRSFLAIASLMQDGADAEAYSLQINQKQAELSDAAAKRLGEDFQRFYHPVPLGYYLHGVLREASLRDYDDAARSYGQALELLPSHPLLLADWSRASHGVHSPPKHGVLYVMALVGRGPFKVESEEQATSDALLIADRIVSAAGPYSLPPTLAPIKITKMFSPARGIDSVGVQVDGQVMGATMMVTDLAEMATTTYEVKRRELMARAVARRVVKKASIVAAKDGLGVQNSLGSLALDAAGVAWEASESADTRCWGVLPSEIQTLRIELPMGRHDVEVVPVLAGRPVATGVRISCDITDGRNSYLLCYYPDSGLVGDLQVSHP
jgi:hypothetical protein